MLEKQVYVYNLDTSAFYFKDEWDLLSDIKKLKSELENSEDKECKKALRKSINDKKNEFKEKLNNNTETRHLDKSKLNSRNVIAVFESTFTRVLGITNDVVSDEFMVIRTFYYSILRDLILNGFYVGDEKYVLYTASAGQIRTKKTVFVKESTIKKYENTLNCGLTIDKINERGGVNQNKYMAYTALNNSATDKWNIDITKTIVVPDFENVVTDMVDFFDDVTYGIERKTMDIPLNQTDGCGMMLPRVSKKNMMVRLPWIKGLLATFDFIKFIETHSCSPVVKDIYGVEHDLIKEDIRVIFTESQFKMHKYYNNWKEYQDNYIKYNCKAGKCLVEEDKIPNSRFNYQMIQTLVDITDEEIDELISTTVNDLLVLSKDLKVMLKTFGVQKGLPPRGTYAKALKIYPEMLKDKYSKRKLNELKKSMIKQAKSGKFEINAKYTFIIPDLYAFCQHLFLNEPNPKGLLSRGEVSSRLYDNGLEVDCLRSPHLYMEHGIRTNVVTDTTNEWFTTNAVYVSCDDLLSKLLMFDCDGDKMLLCADQTIVNIAKRNIAKMDIVPLHYEMKKAEAVELNNQSMYDGIISAYSNGNIGIYSNNISKLWNVDGEIDIELIKILTAENNFCIDCAKTLYMPTRPKEIEEKIRFTNSQKLPHFFKYAKDKKIGQIQPSTNSGMCRLENKIPNKQISYDYLKLGKFNYRKLMYNPNQSIIQEVIDKYKSLRYNKIEPENEFANYNAKRQYQKKINRDFMLSTGFPIELIVDSLVRYLYEEVNTPYKEELWNMFGNELVNNLEMNVNNDMGVCVKCGKRFKQTSNFKSYCDHCSIITRRKRQKKYVDCLRVEKSSFPYN